MKILFLFLVLLGIFALTVFRSHARSVSTETASDTALGSATASEMSDDASVMLGTTTIRLEVADTQEERTRGLSGRTALPEDTGLLFIFDREAPWGFWMKDMHFPIDMIWLDRNFKVVGLESSVSPETYPEAFRPQAPALYVIEVNAGLAQENNIHIGETLSVVL